MDIKNSDSASCDQLTELLGQLCALQAAMPGRPLRPGERRELGGHLFSDGPGFVMAVGRAVAGDPERFRGTGADGAALLEQQRLACRWRFLRDGLRALTELAGDGYLRAQSGAIQEAQRVARLVKDAPGGDLDCERRLLLVPAYFIIDGYQKALDRRKKERREARRAAAPPAPSRRSAAEVRAARAARQERLAAFHDGFFGYVEALSAGEAARAAASSPAALAFAPPAGAASSVPAPLPVQRRAWRPSTVRYPIPPVLRPKASAARAAPLARAAPPEASPSPGAKHTFALVAALAATLPPEAQAALLLHLLGESAGPRGAPAAAEAPRPPLI
jgi:hypothetical protein